MLVSHRCKFIYMKTKKTGGTSVEIAFEPLCREKTVDRLIDTTDTIVSEAGVVGARGGGNPGEGNSRYHDHMSAAVLRTRVGEERWANYLKFCVVRQPWEKVVSMFHYRKPKIQVETPEVIINEFRGWLHSESDVGIGEDWNVYTIKDEPAFDVVIRHDQIAKDSASLLRLFDADNLELPRFKTNHRKNATLNYIEYYDDESRNRVSNAFEKSINLFGWVFDSLKPAFPGASDNEKLLEDWQNKSRFASAP